MNAYWKITVGALLLAMPGLAQEKPAEWTLRSCIDYAKEQNIQVRKSRVALEQERENTSQSKAQLFPSLVFSTGHNLVNRPSGVNTDKNSYSADYGFSSSVALYQGGKLRTAVKQSQMQEQVQELTIKEAENDIELAVTEAFVQVLYANEAVKINRNTVEVAEAQVKRAEKLLQAGSISRSDLAQIESQYSTDKYQLVTALTTFDNQLLQLKQLLELEITDQMNLQIPELTDDEVLVTLPDKEGVYTTALSIMPQVKYSALNINVTELEKSKAFAGYLPQLKLSAGVGTGHGSGSGYSFGSQIRNSFNESVGVTLSVPIFSNRSNRTAVKLAQLGIENSQLEYQGVRKDLLKSVETAWLDATSSQDRFRAAKESLRAAEISYRLVDEQFSLGMKNTLELLTEKNNLLSAQQEMLQGKYMAVLNRQLLNFYEGKTIQIGENNK